MKTSILTITEICSRIESIWIQAEQCRMMHPEILLMLETRVWNVLSSKTPAGKARYSRETRGYASGFNAALFQRVMREKLEFCYLGPDGVLFSTHKASKHRLTEEFYKENKGHLLGTYPCTHVWKDTDKPFAPFLTIGQKREY